jgi:hypothetical protein
LHCLDERRAKASQPLVSLVDQQPCRDPISHRAELFATWLEWTSRALALSPAIALSYKAIAGELCVAEKTQPVEKLVAELKRKQMSLPTQRFSKRGREKQNWNK